MTLLRRQGNQPPVVSVAGTNARFWRIDHVYMSHKKRQGVCQVNTQAAAEKRPLDPVRLVRGVAALAISARPMYFGSLLSDPAVRRFAFGGIVLEHH